MGMTINDHIEVLKSYHNGFTGYVGNLQDSIDFAIDTVCKYQKIEQILKDCKECELVNDYALDEIKKVVDNETDDT